MGRLCAVPNCPSGHDRDRTRRKHAGLRQASLFSVPKHNNMTKVWSRLLGLDLSERHLVCELHFSKDSIKTEDQIRLPDGTIHRIPRQHWALTEGATPVAIAEKENIGCDPGIPNAHKETAIVSDSRPFETKSVTDVRTFRKEIVLVEESLVPFAATSITDVQTLRREASLVLDTPLAPNEATSTVEVPNLKKKVALVRRASSSCGTAPVAAASIAEIDFDHVDEHLQSDDFADNLMETSSNISNDIQEHSGLRKEVHHEDDTYDFAGHLMETSVESLSASSEIEGNIGASDDEPMQLLIDDILAHLEKRPLSETWCWARNRKDEDSIVFVKIDPYSYEPTLRLIVYNDLSVTVCTADEKANMQLDSTLSSIRSLQTLLDDLGKKVVCNGTGMHDERRDHHCSGFVRPGEYGKFVNAPRCSPCRKLRRKIQNLNNRRKSDLKTRYARSKHAANMKQRVCKRLRDKGKLLLQEVVRAHQQCSAVGEQALHDAISELPDVQQEAVRACFNAAKVQTNQRRYTLERVYECLLMRIKNSKLYEHLRSRNILPLPCKDT